MNKKTVLTKRFGEVEWNDQEEYPLGLNHNCLTKEETLKLVRWLLRIGALKLEELNG